MALLSPLVAMALVATVSASVDGYLERSALTDFSGEQLVSCDTPDGPRTALLHLAQRDGSVTVWDPAEPGSAVVMGAGSATLAGPQAKTTLVEVTAVAEPAGYEEVARAEVTYLGRPAVEVAFARYGSERVRFTVDEATGVVVRMRSYDGDGGLYCERRLLSFEVGEGQTGPAQAAAEVENMEALSEIPAAYPEVIGEFRLLDAYLLESGTLGYYSDGFFSAGVVITSRSVTVPDEAVTVGLYRRVYQPGNVVVTWGAREGNVVVMGDLPPDLLDSFLAELPSPYEEGLLGRLLRRWFR